MYFIRFKNVFNIYWHQHPCHNSQLERILNGSNNNYLFIILVNMRHVDRLLSLFCLLMMTFNFMCLCAERICASTLKALMSVECFPHLVNIISIILIISSMSRFDFERTCVRKWNSDQTDPHVCSAHFIQFYLYNAKLQQRSPQGTLHCKDCNHTENTEKTLTVMWPPMSLWPPTSLCFSSKNSHTSYLYEAEVRNTLGSGGWSWRVVSGFCLQAGSDW